MLQITGIIMGHLINSVMAMKVIGLRRIAMITTHYLSTSPTVLAYTYITMIKVKIPGSGM